MDINWLCLGKAMGIVLGVVITTVVFIVLVVFVFDKLEKHPTVASVLGIGVLFTAVTYVIYEVMCGH